MTTEAGRALLERLHHELPISFDDVAAIEAQAAQAERERIVAGMAALPLPDAQYPFIDVTLVLRVIEGKEPE